MLAGAKPNHTACRSSEAERQSRVWVHACCRWNQDYAEVDFPRGLQSALNIILHSEVAIVALRSSQL